MSNFKIYNLVANSTSKLVTEKYSTSFSIASRLFRSDLRQHIYNIYGFVRFADEIVDTFHGFDKAVLMQNFEKDYEYTLQNGISLNPIIHSFCNTKKEKNIPNDLVDAFLISMKMDLGSIQNINDETYKKYIYGSAEVVGLMCLKVFVNSEQEYNDLKHFAQSLGAAFQKINFLRDLSSDYNDLNRTYFPNVNFANFSVEDKKNIEKEIEADFNYALIGIQKLPISSKIAVLMAFKYYKNLFIKIKKCKPEVLIQKRIRISNFKKIYLLLEMLLTKKMCLR